MAEETKRLNVVISTELHRELKVEAAKSGTTIAQFVADAIAQKVESERANQEEK